MIIRFGPVGLLGVGLVVGVASGTVRVLGRTPYRRALIESLFAAYIVMLLTIVFLESSHFAIPGRVVSWRECVNLAPLKTIAEYVFLQKGQAFRQLVGNVALFVPLGALLPVLSVRWRAARSLVGTALLVSVGIEITQLALLLGKMTDRSVDVDDVILNVLGAALGFALWRLVSRESGSGEIRMR